MKTIKKLKSFKAKYVVGLIIYVAMATIAYNFNFNFTMIVMLFMAAVSLAQLAIDRNFNYAVIDSDSNKTIREFEYEKDAIEFADNCNRDVKVVNLFIK